MNASGTVTNIILSRGMDYAKTQTTAVPCVSVAADGCRPRHEGFSQKARRKAATRLPCEVPEVRQRNRGQKTEYIIRTEHAARTEPGAIKHDGRA